MLVLSIIFVFAVEKITKSLKYLDTYQLLCNRFIFLFILGLFISRIWIGLGFLVPIPIYEYRFHGTVSLSIGSIGKVNIGTGRFFLQQM